MVIHPVALSEIPEHLCGHSVRRLFTQFQKSIGAGPPVFEVLSSFQSLCLPGWTLLYQKTAKRQKRRACYCLINVHKQNK